MERSGTLSEPSDNSTTPYIKKETNPFGSASFCLARYPVKCQVEVQILMPMENGVNIGRFLHRLVQKYIPCKKRRFLSPFLAIWRNSYLPRTQLTIILSLPQASLNSPGSRTQFREWSTYAKSSAFKWKVTVLVSPGRSSTFV